MTKKIMLAGLLAFGAPLYPISSVLNHRLITSSPLLFKQDDYSQKQLSFEMEPFVSNMFDPKQAMQNIGINGQSDILLSQEGLGDFNPAWVLLGSLTGQDYTSVVNLKPELSMFGVMLHLYKQFENFFFDVRTALTNCKTIINIEEVGTNNGGVFKEPNGQPVYDAYDAFTQSDWQYGKFGVANSMIKLDNIQIELGFSGHLSDFSSDRCKKYAAGFVLLEIPTGTGTTAEWLFEPQVGTNHWAFGFGADFMAVAENGFSLVLGGNFRHPIANWETRSFDLTENGQWSRYLGLQAIGSSVPALPLPGINLFTQQALVGDRDQITAYARLQRHFTNCLLELSYNYFYARAEQVRKVNNFAANYGIFDINTILGGVATASRSQIWQSTVVADTTQVPVTASDLNLASGAMGHWMSNSFATRLQVLRDGYTLGLGAMVDLAASQQAISTWAVWFNFEILLPE